MNQQIDAVETNGHGTNELETLREVIFGNQARLVQSQLAAVERQMGNQNKTLLEQINHLKTASQNEYAQLAESLSQQIFLQQEELESFKATIELRLNVLQDEIRNQFDTLRADQQKLIALEAAKAETQRIALREELFDLVSTLEQQKSSRAELGDLLMALGNQVKGNGLDEKGQLASESS